MKTATLTVGPISTLIVPNTPIQSARTFCVGATSIDLCGPHGRESLIGLLLIFFCACSARAGANLLNNGDFELGNVGFVTSYQFSPGNLVPEVTYDITTNPAPENPNAVSYGDHTTGSGLMMAVNGSTNANTLVWAETPSVRPNTQYTFSLWVSSWTAPLPLYPAANLEVDLNGSPISFNAPATAGVWQAFSTVWNSGSDTSLVIELYDRNVNAGGNDFAFDDISLQVVPEPSTWAILALGADVLLATRRRR